MTTSELVAIVLTSTVISSVVAFLLRYIFESRQQYQLEKQIEELKHQYEIQIERLRAELSLDASVRKAIEERKLRSYPQLVELIYRTRNMARELNNSNYTSVLAEELRSRSDELEDYLYSSRIDLERDGIFSQTHTYKNLIKNFNLTLKDILFHQSNGDQQMAERSIGELDSIYRSIEVLHKSIISKLSSYGSELHTHDQDENPSAA